MFTTRLFLLIALGAAIWSGCATTSNTKPRENQFYKEPHVRRCLQLDKEGRASEAQACWSKLLQTLESDPSFKAKTKLTEADLAKVQRMVGQSVGRSDGLHKEMDSCLKIMPGKREERLACFRDYLARNSDKLSVAEKYEVETAITAMEKARELAQGNVENTLEHAGKLLGGKFHAEDGGLRIDQVSQTGPLALAQTPEQGLIVAVDGTTVAEFDPTELVSRLESCQERPIKMLIRQGGNDQVMFSLIECSCSEKASGKKHWQTTQAIETCTGENAQELSLGISWCYLATEGILEVEEVCKGSPADTAGVHPDHRYVAINDQLLLGLTYGQIANLLKSHPAKPLQLKAQGGALSSPAPLTGKALEPGQQQKFWKALKSTLDSEAQPVRP